jgi:hypothetical protein
LLKSPVGENLIDGMAKCVTKKIFITTVVEVLGLVILIAICLLIMVGPPILLFIISWVKWNSNKGVAKIFFTLAVIWLIVGGWIYVILMS